MGRHEWASTFTNLKCNRVVHGSHFRAIFGSFSVFIRVVHSSHFWLIFSFIFGSFLGVWQKNDQNDPKNETKNDVKNGYCERSETQTSGK